MKSPRIAIFGEVLFDCFPDGKRILGGAPFNVAWHLQAFGENPLFISRVGRDQDGQAVRRAMQGWGMDLRGLQEDPENETAIVAVSFEAGEPRYDIVENRAFDFMNARELPILSGGEVLYHGTLATRKKEAAAALDFLIEKYRPRVFIDVNLRAPWWERRPVRELMRRGRWLKLNHEELEILVPEGKNEADRMAKLMADAAYEAITLTRGKAGAETYSADSKRHSVAPRVQAEVVDTVGAGDAFCSVLLLGIVRQWPVPVTLQRAQAFASAIVGKRGATVSEPEFYQTFLNEWD